MERSSNSPDGRASTYRRGVLAYLLGKIGELEGIVERLAIIDNRGELITSALQDLWSDSAIGNVLKTGGLHGAPAALLAAGVQLARAPSPGTTEAVAERPPQWPGIAWPLAEWLGVQGEPPRVYAFMAKLDPSRQCQTATLIAACGDNSKAFLAALLAATPQGQRTLVIKLGPRGRALQAELAEAEGRLSELVGRQAELLDSCDQRAIQLVVAAAYVRQMFARPFIRDWMTRHRPAVADALQSFDETTTTLIEKASRAVRMAARV